MKILKSHKSFGGTIHFCEHDSKVTQTKMKFSTYTPPGQVKGALIWLSGLTCTDENFMMKAGAQKYLSEAGLMLICPDTSPRGLNLPHEHDNYDFGSGAGFYVNATTPGYKDHYRMYDYVAHEIYGLLESEFKMQNRISISGHSMGGHGALIIGLRETKKFKSVSAFAPIVNPTKVPWGQRALAGYLGENPAQWKLYDACEIILSGQFHPEKILIDQGSADEFLEKNLMPQNFEQACLKDNKQTVQIRLQQGYDHSYYFIASFIEEHIQFHAKYLN